jgi:hypothetical protein
MYTPDGHNYWVPWKIIQADRSDSLFNVLKFQMNQEMFNYSGISQQKKTDLDKQ